MACRRLLLLSLVFAFAELLSACAAYHVEPDQPAGLDLSTPRALMTAYADAVLAADRVTLRACTHATTTESRRNRDDLIDATVGVRRLYTVIHQHFTLPASMKDPYIFLGSDDHVQAGTKDLLARTIHVDGDRATVDDMSSSIPPLRRISGRWVFDFDEYRNFPAEYHLHGLRCRSAMPLLNAVEAGRITTFDAFYSAWNADFQDALKRDPTMAHHLSTTAPSAPAVHP